MLNILAKTPKDILQIRPYLQDAIVPKMLMHFVKPTFSMHVNRFCWEHDKPQRTACLFVAEGCQKVEHIHFKNAPKNLNLLTIEPEDEQHLMFRFSGHHVMRLTLDSIDVRIFDFEEPWPASRKPVHVYELF